MAAPPVVASCALCGLRASAAIGGICTGCAAAMMTGPAFGRTCPQCGKLYHGVNAACPSCMAQMNAATRAMPGSIAGTTNAAATRFPRQQPLPRADMQVVDLIGWRVWRITSMGYLRSLTAEALWLPGVPMEARSVLDRPSDGLSDGSNYGVHVFKERHGAIVEAEHYTSRSEHHVGYAIGSVLLWGDVVEHERGYRAERAKILSVDDVTWQGKPPWDKETAEVMGFLRRRYGVEDGKPEG